MLGVRFITEASAFRPMGGEIGHSAKFLCGGITFAA